jgi:hypothetical protein
VKRSTSARLLAAIVALALASSSADAARKPPARGDAKNPGAAESPYAEWGKVTKDAQVVQGFFKVHRKRESLYLEVPPARLGQPFLVVLTFARGIGARGVYGGMPLGDYVVQFERSGDRVLLVRPNLRFTSGGDDAFRRAVEVAYGNSVLASFKIESEQDSSKALLVDLASFLVSDAPDLADRMKAVFDRKSFRFDKDRSRLGSMKMFPENFEVDAELTYSPSEREGLDVGTVPDDRYLPITVHYSMSKLPEPGYVPRYADERVGYFVTAVKDFSRDSAQDFWLRYARRWRLQKKDPAAALSEPVKPIVFYLEKSIPPDYRPYIKAGIEGWNKAFEAAGFKNAIVARDAPDDPDFDPADVRFSTIRWIVSSQPTFGAIGPSRTDPRTGEILDADILIEASAIQNYRNNYRRYVGPEAEAREILSLEPEPGAPWLDGEHACAAAAAFEDAGALQHLALLASGALPPGSPVPMEYLGEALVRLALHEVGHTLGLRHNFMSSIATPYSRLHDKTFTAEHGLTGSVMEYPGVNVSGDAKTQGHYYTPVVGAYDVWAIRYGYTPSGAAKPDEEREMLVGIAAECSRPELAYGTDEDARGPSALDPRTNVYDLGDDPLLFARDRTAYLKGLWTSGRLDERVVGPHDSYASLRRAVDALFTQYGVALGMAVKQVGGQQVSRAYRGDPAAPAPFTPVSAAKAREALDFLAQRAFAADAFTLSADLLNRLPAERWGHWGLGSPDRLEFPLHERVLTIQTTLLDGLLSAERLTHVREAELRSKDAIRMSEVFERLSRATWGEVGAREGWAAALEAPGTRRDLQRAYVDRLAAMVVSPPPGLPDDARALARLQLQRIDARCSRALGADAPLGDFTRAHLQESRARIRRTLEAGAQVEDGATSGGRRG